MTLGFSNAKRKPRRSADVMLREELDLTVSAHWTAPIRTAWTQIINSIFHLQKHTFSFIVGHALMDILTLTILVCTQVRYTTQACILGLARNLTQKLEAARVQINIMMIFQRRLKYQTSYTTISLIIIVLWRLCKVSQLRNKVTIVTEPSVAYLGPWRETREETREAGH